MFVNSGKSEEKHSLLFPLSLSLSSLVIPPSEEGSRLLQMRYRFALSTSPA